MGRFFHVAHIAAGFLSPTRRHS